MNRNLSFSLLIVTAVFLAKNALGADRDKAEIDESLRKQCPGMADYQQRHPHPDPWAKIERDDQVRQPDLRVKLLKLFGEDNKAGAAYADEIDKDKPDEKVIDRLAATRANNLHEIRRIVGKFGFPSRESVGEDGVWAAYVLVLHADGDENFQRDLVDQLKIKFERGEIPGQVYAYILDRTRVASGRAQVYGTQLHLVDNVLVLRPIEAPQAVESLRAQADLPSLGDYMCFMQFRSGKHVSLPK